METIQDIFYAELKNLYALEKQTIETLEELNSKSKDSSLQKLMKKLLASSRHDFNMIKDLLNHCQVNPGNTKDSVAEEILLNIKDITRANISEDLRTSGLYPSLFRLHFYKVACYRATQNLAKVIKLKDAKKALKQARKINEEYIEKFNKYSKKAA